MTFNKCYLTNKPRQLYKGQDSLLVYLTATVDKKNGTYTFETTDLTVNYTSIDYVLPNVCVTGCTINYDGAASTATGLAVRVRDWNGRIRLSCEGYLMLELYFIILLSLSYKQGTVQKTFMGFRFSMVKSGCSPF